MWTSEATAAPKKKGFRFVSDDHAVNRQIEKIPGVMPNQEAEMADLRRATCFWEARHTTTILVDAAGSRSPGIVLHRHPQKSVYPTRVPQGGLNATAIAAKINQLD